MSEHTRYTSYKTYKQCPYLYGKRFVEGKPMPDKRIMAIGRRVEDAVNAMMNGSEQVIHKNPVNLDPFEAVEPVMFNMMVTRALSGMTQVTATHGITHAPEMQKVILATLNYAGEEVPIRCTPDYFWDTEKEVVLVDLKTCAKYSTWNEKKALEDPQLNLYGYLLEAIFGKPVVSYYVAVNREDYRVRVLKAAANPKEILSDIYIAHKGIQSGDFSTKVPGWYCNGCEYAEECGQVTQGKAVSSEV